MIKLRSSESGAAHGRILVTSVEGDGSASRLRGKASVGVGEVLFLDLSKNYQIAL